MKIFAKRKRKAAPAGTVVPPFKERSDFASDPVVEALLKTDPKEWNSKQRRMIKRYQERKTEIQEDDSNMIEESSNGDIIPNENVAEKESENEEIAANMKSSDEDDGDGNDDGDLESETTSKHNKSPQKGTSTASADNKDDFVPVTANVEHDHEVHDGDDDGKVDPEHEVYKLLEKLNSKMKRTLSRRLEREGATVLDEVRNEATKILDADSAPKESKKRGVNDLEKEGATIDDETKSKKKRKKEADLSSLSPEERLRREEQRQKQRQAAERRAMGEYKTPGFKHPLNSERRRANRRKSKWKSGKPSSETKPVKNEHNSSGFLHRKQAT